MNWWNNVKLAMPLPKAENYPDAKTQALSRMDKRLEPESAKSFEEQHPQASYLGHGRSGVAYTTNQPNTVVKLTFEPLEAQAAQKLMNHGCPCVVKVFGVERQQQSQVHPDPMSSKPEVWKITTQKVPLLPDGEEKDWIRYLSKFVFDTGDLPSPKEVEEALKEEGFYDDGKHRVGDFRFLAKYYSKYRNLIMCLRQNDFMPTDAHEDNIGVGNDGQYVIFDLGGLL